MRREDACHISDAADNRRRGYDLLPLGDDSYGSGRELRSRHCRPRYGLDSRRDTLRHSFDAAAHAAAGLLAQGAERHRDAILRRGIFTAGIEPFRDYRHGRRAGRYGTQVPLPALRRMLHGQHRIGIHSPQQRRLHHRRPVRDHRRRFPLHRRAAAPARGRWTYHRHRRRMPRILRLLRLDIRVFGHGRRNRLLADRTAGRHHETDQYIRKPLRSRPR